MGFARRAFVFACVCASSRPAAPAPADTPPAFRMQQLADGVYVALRRQPLAEPVDANNLVVIGADGVLVVDANVTPSSTRAVLQAIRGLTDRPVRYVVTTHWHEDHHFGNQVYREAFPDVEFVAHAATFADMDTSAAHQRDFLRDAPPYLERLRQRLASGQDAQGKPLTAEQRTQIEQRIAATESVLPELAATRLVYPTLTFEADLVLHGIGRRVHLLWLGRGNTRGDLLVHLPDEKILATGDLLVHPVPFALGSYLGEWVETLAKVRALDATTIVLSHGEVQKDWRYLDLVSSLLGAVLEQTRAAVGRGLDLEATRAAVDLSSFEARFGLDDPARRFAWTHYFVQPAVERAWLEARGALD